MPIVLDVIRNDRILLDLRQRPVRFDVRFLVPLAAGNFLYIGASDLVPEVNKAHTIKANFVHFTAFVAGLGLLLGLRAV